MSVSTHLSIITLNVNRLNSPIKRHRVSERIKKQDPSICCLQEAHFRSKGTQKQGEGMEKIFCSNGNEKNAVVVILISGKIDFKPKTVIEDKEGQYIMITVNPTRKCNIYKCIATQQRSS